MANPFRVAALRRRSILGLDNTGSTGFNYAGAGYNRLTSDWIGALIASADQESRWDLYRLRARARDLKRNNPYAARFVAMVGENVIGHQGIRLQAQVGRPDGTLDSSINGIIERAWLQWGRPATASASGKQSWVDLQRLAVRTVAVDGEALFRVLPAFNGDGFALQQLDIDLLDHTFNRPPGKRENEIRMGVEVDQWGRPIAYHLWTVHPYDLNGGYDRERIRVPASDIVHLYRDARPGQTRAVTWFAPVMLPLRMLNGFVEAELIAARTAASTMGLLKKSEEAQEDPDAPGAEGTFQLEVEPGTITEMPAGYVGMDTFAAAHPNVQFAEFTKAMVRWIAGGLSVSYNGLGNDLESVNYSSIRAGLLSERDHWRELQTWVAEHFCAPVFQRWLAWGVASGRVELPARNVSRWYDHRWLPRGWQWVDPLKDVTAAAASLQLSLDSRTNLVGEEGRDLEEVFRDIREERALAQDYGIELVDVIGNARLTESATAKTEPGGEVVPEGTDEEKDDAEAARTLDALLGQLRRRAALNPTNGNGNRSHS